MLYVWIMTLDWTFQSETLRRHFITSKYSSAYFQSCYSAAAKGMVSDGSNFISVIEITRSESTESTYIVYYIPILYTKTFF